MKQTFTFLKLLTLVIAVLIAPELYAQTIPSAVCQTGRYLTSQFGMVDTSTVLYGSALDVRGTRQFLKATIYSPNADTASNRPAVIVMFGGSFVSGSRNDWYVIQTCNELAKRGYVAVAIDYRIGVAGFTYNDLYRTIYRSAQDFITSVRYLQANALTYRIRPDLIYAWGFSAGAINAIQGAYWTKSEVDYSIIDTLTMGTFDASSGTSGIRSVRGIISNAGGIGDTNWITANEYIPVHSVHNIGDNTVPYFSGPLPIPGAVLHGSYPVTRRLKRLGVNASLKTFNNGSMHLPGVTDPYLDSFFVSSITPLAAMVCQDLDIIISLKPSQSDEVVSVYPNPVHDKIWINGLSRPSTFLLFNATGQVVHQQQISAGSTQVDLVSLPQGLYHWRLADRRGRLIKQ